MTDSAIAPADNLKDKIVFITGAGAGMGREFALTLAKSGATVAVTDLDLTAAEGVVQLIESAGGRALAIACNVGDEHAVEAAVARTTEAFGGIDILINNAACHLSRYGQPFDKMPREDIRDLFNVNILGVINCTLACKDSMIARGGGIILNMSSMAGYMVVNGYGVTKLAVRGLTAAFASQLGCHNIRVNAIAPGLIATEAAMADIAEDHKQFALARQKINRLGEMSDITNLMMFLCGPESSFITGETIRCTGGSVLSMG